ncbi:hypothetical protein P7K49_016453 [Saguinus oedipus]|uniref:(2E,6E)-farnesyl diphosphate synthase n=1 Tax=Saguinus oedipus TaxID=9490 RepID=A0ABQ9VC46_SAGOE|nr:hypothetical protein P7K49_016453 [Saguinus oedipus]
MGHPETGDAIAWLKEVLEYNAIGGKYHRGLTVLVAFWELMEPRKQDADSLQWALTVGWCAELLQAFFLKPGMGLDATYDAILLEACIYCLLKLYCREQPYYLNLIELFLQSSDQTEIGFTEKRYKSIVKYKMEFYSFHLPIAAAMYMAGIDGEKEYANAKKIMLEMGEFFQI